MSTENVTAIAVPPDRPPQTAPEVFMIHDAKSANWPVRKIVETRAYAQHVKEWAEAEVRRAEREEQFYLHRYGHQLQVWAKSQLTSGRRKCIKLPAGTLGFRNDPTKLDVIDEKNLIGWCRKSLPDALRTEVRVLKSLVKDHFQKTGEVPDGTITTGWRTAFLYQVTTMERGKRKLKEWKAVSSKKDNAGLKQTASNRSLPNHRPRLKLAVAVRRQTPELQRQYSAAIDGFLTELVRQHLDAAKGKL